MAESSGGGDLGVGLRDISSAKERLVKANGLQEQIDFNQRQLNTRLLAGYFVLLIISVLTAWITWMPELIRFGFLLLFVTSLAALLFMQRLKKHQLGKLREQQLIRHQAQKTQL